jgi:predicted nuclease of predicted toxin-antitoxin system
MARLYADEDFDRTVVVELRRLGHDAITIQEDGCGNRGVPDDGVLALAKHIDRAVLTYNRIDFIHLHNQSAEHKGIIVCTRDPDAAALAARIHAAIEGRPSLDGQLLRINRLP